VFQERKPDLFLEKNFHNFRGKLWGQVLSVDDYHEEKETKE
jgi:hypothetical protein